MDTFAGSIYIKEAGEEKSMIEYTDPEMYFKLFPHFFLFKKQKYFPLVEFYNFYLPSSN